MLLTISPNSRDHLFIVKIINILNLPYLRKNAIVTGSSSGIGLETSLTLAENSFITYATMQNLDKAPTVLKFAEKKEFANKCSPAG